jgi:predicted 3-demethylubiquinone-9 3-methyltransferase (glyoxalase superfamily)
MQKVTPFLWFNGQAEEAANFYTSIFKNSRIVSIARYGQENARIAGKPAGAIMTVSFQLEGIDFIALNGGAEFSFSSAISFLIDCASHAEVDELWEKLCDGGQAMQCGWLTDRFGITWQIVPSGLREMLSDPDPARSQRVMKAMLPMKKLDIDELRGAYEG